MWIHYCIFADGEKLWLTLKILQKNPQFSENFGVLSAEKMHFSANKNRLSLYQQLKILILQSLSVKKRTTICNFFEANCQNSYVVLYDDELFLWDCWATNSRQPYFQKGPSPGRLTNLTLNMLRWESIPDGWLYLLYCYFVSKVC